MNLWLIRIPKDGTSASMLEVNDAAADAHAREWAQQTGDPIVIAHPRSVWKVSDLGRTYKEEVGQG